MIQKEYFKGLKLKVFPKEYAVIKSKKLYKNAFANIDDGEEITVIVEESDIEQRDIINIERDFKIITFDTLVPFNLIGFIAEIVQALAKENISIFVVSGFSTDFILVKKKDLTRTIKTLGKVGVKI